MRIITTIITHLASLLLIVTVAQAQTQTITVRLGHNEIAVVKTAEGITTRLIFHEQVNEIICGSLYDPESGTGSFVIQRINNDIFLKPVVSKGLSNVFVRAGKNGEFTYSFDLQVVPAAQAHRIVDVVKAQTIVAGVKIEAQSPKQLAMPPIFKPVDVVACVTCDTPNGLYQAVMLTGFPPPPASKAEGNSGHSKMIYGSAGAIRREATKRVTPDYPGMARQVGAGGEVLVEVIIDEKGKVVSARPLSGHPLLRPAAVSAARLWKFTSANSTDRLKQVVGTITFRFKKPQS
jgi:TonB family protein